MSSCHYVNNNLSLSVFKELAFPEEASDQESKEVLALLKKKLSSKQIFDCWCTITFLPWWLQFQAILNEHCVPSFPTKISRIPNSFCILLLHVLSVHIHQWMDLKLEFHTYVHKQMHACTHTQKNAKFYNII